MTPPDFLTIGHVTKDVVDDSFRLGGSVTYSALTASKLGLKAAVLTSAGPDLDLALAFEGIDVCCIASTVTTTFRNVYIKEQRRQFILSVSGRLRASDVPRAWLTTPIVHLAPVADELDADLATIFPKAIMGVTPQGWMRGWDEQGMVYAKEWQEVETVLSHADVLILSKEDMGSYREVIEDYAAKVPVLVITEGEKGARVHNEGKWHHIPAFPTVEVEPTGAGDVFAAAYLAHYAKKREAIAAARFASCVASFAVEDEGTEGIPTLEQVEQRLALGKSAI
jgi:sugar/nucleoside kinase (ribokinase family)